MIIRSPTIPSDSDEYVQAVIGLMEAGAAAHFAIYDANRALNRGDVRSELYCSERENFDLALLFLSKAKWYAGQFSGTHLYIAPHTKDMADCAKALQWFGRAKEIAQATEHLLTSDDISAENLPANRYREEIKLSQKEGEILFADDVPIVPSICPIIVLKGSSYEMGRQYIRQVVEIFGTWMYEQIAQRQLTQGDIELIKKWHVYLDQHTPEIPEMVRGWVDSANELGIKLDYWNAIQLWTGHFEPIWKGIKSHGVRDLPELSGLSSAAMAFRAYLGSQGDPGPKEAELGIAASAHDSADTCSGCCAWGDATRDGKLVAGATTDHDCTFQATIVAYPDDGNAFIYTPFSVTGFIPVLGQYFFAGHPGMNSEGLGYVHHGGGAHAIEPDSQRGFGLRRGATTFHNLRYASSAQAALKNELSWPVGDVGMPLGSAGGFYADGGYSYVCEGRDGSPDASRPVIREASYSDRGEKYNFLYANNNSLHPASAKGFYAPERGYQFTVVEGWVADKPAFLANLAGPDQLAGALSTKSSQGRNRHMYQFLHEDLGKIDVGSIKRLYQASSPERYLPDGSLMSHAEREKAWVTGAPWIGSTCNPVNAFTSIMKPDNGGQGIYMGCIGPANRKALMHIPGHGYYYYDQTAEFWDIRLAPTVAELVADARNTAANLLAESQQQLVPSTFNALGPFGVSLLQGLADRAREDFAKGESILATDSKGLGEDELVEIFARAVRCFTSSQVRSRQVASELSHAGRIRQLE